MHVLTVDDLRKEVRLLNESNQRLIKRIIASIDSERASEDAKNKKGSYNGDQSPRIFRRSASQPF